MASKVLITYEADSASLKAAATEAIKYNDEISESAVLASKEVTAAYQKQAKAATAAFGSQETKKALDDQNASIDKLQANLKQLYDEEVRLLASGKKLTDEYKRNQQAANEARQRLAELNRVQQGYVKETEKAVKSNQSLTRQLRTLKQELALLEQQGKDNTKEFQNLLIKAAQLEDQIGDTQQRVKILASDTFKFDAAVGAVGALSTGFELAQAGAALFGKESEDLQKQLLKVQAATALANGVQQVSALLLEQSAVKTAALSAVTGAYNLAVGSSTGALKAFRIALAGTGIGLVVLALVELVTNFEKYAKIVKDFNQSKPETIFGKLGKQIVETTLAPINLLIAGYEKLNSLINPAKEVQKNKGLIEQAIKNEERRFEARSNQIDREVELLKAQGKETLKLEIEKEQIALDFAKRKLDLLNKNEQLIRNTLRDTFDVEGERFELQQEILDRENNITVLRVENQKKGIKKVTEAYKELNLEISKNFELLVSGETLGAESAADAELNRRKITLAELTELENQGLDVSKQIAEAKIKILLQEQFIAIQASKNSAKEQLKNVITGSQAEKQIIDKKNSEILLIETNTANAINEINRGVAEKDKQNQEAIRAERKKTNQDTIAEIEKYVQEFQKLFTDFNQVSKMMSENRIADITSASQAELAAINESTEREVKKQRQREALELRTSRKIAAEKTRQAKQDKALAIFNAIVGTAASIVKTQQNLGYPAAIPFQVAAGIIGAAQVAAISAQPLPKYEKGGVVGGKRHSQGGTMIEAEVDEFVVKRPQSIKHRRLLADLNDSTEKFKQNIERNYIRPALLEYATGRKRDTTFNVNATLNSKSMEKEIRAMRKDLKNNKPVINFNLPDSRYAWQ